MDTESLHKLFLSSDGITTDTRNLKKSAIFFALKGDSFNGNDFAIEAIQAGCSYAIVDEDVNASNNERIIKVDNVLVALQNLANYHRNQFNIPIIGITGSNGKTTTKELAGAVLLENYNVLVTKGNLNNHLGVPFTLLRLNKSHEIAIIEMGANKPGDIKELADIANPTHGIISNIGAAHIEGFGSLQGVIKTKGELYDSISEKEGHLFLNNEDETLNAIVPKSTTLFTYGEKGGNIKGELLDQNPFVRFKWEAVNYKSPILETQLIGKYNFTNFLSAIAIGVYFNVDNDKINKAIEGYKPSNNRSQITKTAKNTLIVDCYNANATSMKAALDSFAEMKGENKLAILGDMLELGDISAEEHQKIIAFLEKNQMDALLVGTEMSKTTTSLKKYPNWKALLEKEEISEISDSIILLKGSRNIKLEELIPHFS